MCDIDSCTELRTQGSVSFKERGAYFRLENPNKCDCKKVKVDGCLPINGPRCDWAALSDETSALIELKGSDFDHAVKQIKNTLRWFLQSTTIKINISYVVMQNRCPAITGKQQTLKDKFFKETGIKVKTVRSGKCMNLQDK